VISREDFDAVVSRCRTIPPTVSVYLATDFVSCLLETVIDFQQHTTTVERAVTYFNEHRWDEVRTLDELQRTLAAFADDKDGNTAVATHLWGYKLWTRARMLRDLTAFFAAQNIDDLESLRAWAEKSSFKRDFEGRVFGLGPTVYNWLVMRFVESTLGRKVRETEAVEVVCAAARVLGLKSYELDWRIWEFQRAQ
jgi:hypothetical protein